MKHLLSFILICFCIIGFVHSQDVGDNDTTSAHIRFQITNGCPSDFILEKAKEHEDIFFFINPGSFDDMRIRIDKLRQENNVVLFLTDPALYLNTLDELSDKNVYLLTIGNFRPDHYVWYILRDILLRDLTIAQEYDYGYKTLSSLFYETLLSSEFKNDKSLPCMNTMTINTPKFTIEYEFLLDHDLDYFLISLLPKNNINK